MVTPEWKGIMPYVDSGGRGGVRRSFGVADQRNNDKSKVGALEQSCGADMRWEGVECPGSGVRNFGKAEYEIKQNVGNTERSGNGLGVETSETWNGNVGPRNKAGGRKSGGRIMRNVGNAEWKCGNAERTSERKHRKHGME